MFKKLVLIFILGLFCCFSTEVWAGEREIREENLTAVGPIASLKISGKVTLGGKNSLMRVVLVDSLNREYLIYETDSAREKEKTIFFQKECAESCYLDNILPQKVRFETVGATLEAYSFDMGYQSDLNAKEGKKKKT